MFGIRFVLVKYGFGVVIYVEVSIWENGYKMAGDL